MSTRTVTDTTGASAPAMLRAAFVRRPHGVRGALRAEPLGGASSRFRVGLCLWTEVGDRQLVVRGARPLPGGDVLLELQGVDDHAAAEALRGAYLRVPQAERRVLEEREWFVYELVGLRATTPEGGEVGVVADIEEYPGHEVMVIRGGNGVIRLPMVAEFVSEVDVEGGAVVVTPLADEDG